MSSRRSMPALLRVGAVVVASGTTVVLTACAGEEGSTPVVTEGRVVATTAAPDTTIAVVPEPTPTIASNPTGASEPQTTTIFTEVPTTPLTEIPTTPFTEVQTTTLAEVSTTTESPPVSIDPHGAPIESRCVRSNIDFAAVREAPGIAQPQVGQIAPSTCDVQVYATGTDGRIAWLEVGIGDLFGWSAESNFLKAPQG